MSIVNLATSTTLEMVEAFVKARLGDMNEQQNLVWKEKVDDVVHQSFVSVRMIARRLLDRAFSTTLRSSEGEFYEANGFIGLEGVEPVDYSDVKLFDFELNGFLPIKSDAEFYSILSTPYNTNVLKSAVYGRMTTITVATATKLRVQTFRGIQRAIPSHVITAATNAEPMVFTSAAHGLISGDYVFLTGIADNGLIKVTVSDVDTFSGGKGTTDYVDGGSFVRVPVQELNFSRIPRRTTTKTDKVDMPEGYVPISIDMATVELARLLTKTPPVDVDRRVLAFVETQFKQG